MVIGLEQYRDPRLLTLGRVLLLPFRDSGGSYPMAGRSDER